MTITAAIIAKSENISDITLKSIAFVDEIIVIIDSDQDRKPVTRGDIRYFFRPLNGDFSSQRNFALANCNSDWVLFVDDDEYVSSLLANEIKERTKSKSIRGYYLNRFDVVFHDVLRHGETGNTKILRLARKDAGKFSRTVHEHWIVPGLVADLESPLYHVKDHFVSEFSDRMALYGPQDASELESENKPFSFFRLLVFPKAKFFQNYFLRCGFLDGTSGLFLAYLMAIQSLSVRIFQWTTKR
jgi:glycosyltransferase involved in cell wall biosynthesis